MLGGRRDDAGELAVLDPGGVEHLDVADPVREDDPLAVPVEAVIDERPVGLRALGPGQGGAVEDQAVEEAVPRRRELDEAAAPEGLVAERLGVEAGGQLAVSPSRTQTPLGTVTPAPRKTPQSSVPRSVWFQRPSTQVSSFWLPQWPCVPPSRPGKGGQKRRDARLLRKYSASLA